MHAPTSPTNSNGRIPSPVPGANSPLGGDAKPQAADGGRDAHGRFVTGNPGGPGNPFARRVAALRSALLASVAPEDIQAVACELVRQAREGNLAAARLLLSYTLGKPAPAVDPDTLDLHEFKLYRRVPDPSQAMLDATTRPALPFALDYMRTVRPGLAGAQMRTLAEEARARQLKEEAEAAAKAERAARRQARKAAAGPQPSGNGGAAGQRREAPSAPPPPTPEATAADAGTLAILNQLLATAQPPSPSTNGSAGAAPPQPADRPCQAVPPPSPNGGPSRL
jgi:hypothetical protein